MNRINNITFKGALGDKFVREIVVNQRPVSADMLLSASKSRIAGLDSSKVGDIYESFSESLMRATKEKASLFEQMERAKNEFSENIKREIIERENDMIGGFNSILKEKDKKIQEQELTISQLRQYESMAKVKSLDEIDTVMPETAIETAKSMVENESAAEESLLKYLLTGKGQEKALEQIERAQVLIKAQSDGITDIPDVKNAIQENNVYYSEPLFFLKNMMRAVLRDEKASIVVSPVLATQIKTNMMGLLTPHCNNSNSNTTVSAVNLDLGEIIDTSASFHKSLAERKEQLRKEYPEASNIVYDRTQDKIYVYNNNNEPLATRIFIF